MAIGVFVHNLGAVINAQTGSIEHTNTVTHVDTFVKPLNGTIAGGSSGSIYGSNGGTEQQTGLQGTMIGTQ